MLGIKVICTAHGANLEGVKQNKNLREMLELKFFQKLVFLKENGTRGHIDNIVNI